MRTKLVILWALFFVSLYAQEPVTRTYDMGTRIDRLWCDSVGNQLTVFLRGTTKSGKWLDSNGEVRILNLNDLSPRWNTPIRYQVEQTGCHSFGFLKTTNGKTTLYDNQTGAKRWTQKIVPWLLARNDHALLAYSTKGWSSKNEMLACYLPTTGEKVWEREIPHEFGWTDSEMLNDSTLLVASDGLHTINLFTGLGWDYEASTGAKNYSEMLATNALGVVMGALTGVAVYNPNAQKVTWMVSNVLLCDSLIYQANRKTVACLRYNGEVVWETPLPSKLTAYSQIFPVDDKLYLLNYGYAYLGQKRVNAGRPYLACFNRATGEELFLNRLTEKKDQIESASIKSNAVYMFFDNGMAYHALADSSAIEIVPWNAEKYGKIAGIVRKDLFVLNADSTLFYTISNDVRCIVYTEKEDCYEVNDRLEVMREFPRDSYFLPVQSWNGYTIITRENKFHFIDAAGVKLADLEGVPQFICSDKLYGYKENLLYVVDLNRLIHP